MVTTIARLSPYNITDPLIRSALYREIRAGNPNWPVYTIQPDEVLRPELAAYRHYGNEDMKWVVLIVTGLDDFRESLEGGEQISLPPAVWVRERIQYYTKRGRVIASRA